MKYKNLKGKKFDKKNLLIKYIEGKLINPVSWKINTTLLLLMVLKYKIN